MNEKLEIKRQRRLQFFVDKDIRPSFDWESKIEKTNINFKSIYVPEGIHHVLFSYDPVLFRYSLYAYSLGLIFALVIAAGKLSSWRYSMSPTGKKRN